MSRSSEACGAQGRAGMRRQDALGEVNIFPFLAALMVLVHVKLRIASHLSVVFPLLYCHRLLIVGQTHCKHAIEP